MKKSLLFGFAATMMLASCTTNEEVMDMAKQQEMSFSAFANKSTKAPISDLTKQEKTFGLFGYKSKIGQENAVVFQNTKVTYEGTDWTPADIRYWDNTCSYEFFAYAPNDVISEKIACEPANDQMTITDFEVNQTVADQKDILIAAKVERANASGTSLIKDQVNFTFHHILTKVNIQFAKGEGTQTTILKSINLKDVPTKGNCAVKFENFAPKAVWTINTEAAKKSYPLTMGENGNGNELTTSMQTAIENLLMIPQIFTILNLTYQLTILNGSNNANDKIELGVTEVVDWTNTTNGGNM